MGSFMKSYMQWLIAHNPFAYRKDYLIRRVQKYSTLRDQDIEDVARILVGEIRGSADSKSREKPVASD